MAITALGQGGALPANLVDLKSRLDELQNQLASGRKALSYGGLGSSRSIALGLRAEIAQIGTFKSTISTVSLRLDIADTALQRMQEIADDNRSSLLVAPYAVSADGRTQAQFTAEATLSELVSLLNSQVNGHHLFAGRAAEAPPVVSDTAILDGEAGRAGFAQVLAERRLADLGADIFQSVASIVGTGATASTADAPASIASGVIGADVAQISIDSADLGDSTDTLTGLGILDGHQFTIDIGGASFTVGFFDDGIGTGQDIVIDLDNGGPASGPADIAALAAALNTYTTANSLGTVTDNAGVVEFRPPAGAEYVRFTDGVGPDVAALGLGATGYGTDAKDRLTTKNATLSQLAFEGATLQVDFGGATVGTVTFGTGADVTSLTELTAAIDGFSGVSASQSAGVLTISSTNTTDADSQIVLTANSNATLETVLGFTPDIGGGVVATALPTNLLSPANGLAQGDTLTIQVGSQSTTITFGVNPGEVSTLAELNTVLSAIPNATASVVTSGAGIGNIQVAADVDGEAITISGSPGTAARFGLAEGEVSNLALGRLSVPAAAGSSVLVAEDGAGHPFGFKLLGVSSTLTGTAVNGPAGSPPTIGIGFSSVLPAEGETITIDVALPDGTTTKITLAASAALPPDVGHFTIGTDDPTTAENFRAGLLRAIDRVATTELAAASALQAADDFFAYDSANPPLRVAGPPFETATALVDATPADTVFWYQGDLDTPARDSAAAKVDNNLTIAYGARADEAALTNVVKHVALLAAERFDGASQTEADRYDALTERLIPLLGGANGVAHVSDIATELAQKHLVIKAAEARHDEVMTFNRVNLDSVEAANLEEVAAGILRLQTQLQASFETTAILARLTIANFL